MSASALPKPLTLLILTLFSALAVPAGRAAAQAPSPSDPSEHRIADAEVAYARGLLALHEGDPEEAVRLFEQALAAHPEHEDAGTWLDYARRLARGEEAVEPTREEAPFGDVPTWELGLGLFAGSDSNPALLAADTVAVPFEGTGADAIVGEESDSFTQLDLRAAVHPLVRGGWSLGLVGEGHQTLFGDLDFLDLSRTRGAVHLSFGGDPLGVLAGPLGWVRVPYDDRQVAVLFQLGVAFDELDGQTWRDELAAAVSVIFREGRALATRISAGYRDHDFEQGFEANLDEEEVSLIPQDYSELELAADQSFYLGRRNRYLRVGVSAGERSSDPGAGLNQDASTLGARAELGLPFSRRFTLSLAGSWRQVDFDEVESNPLFPFFFTDRPREDATTRLVAVASWAVKPRLLLTGRVARIDRQADLGPAVEELLDLDYERTVVSLGVRWFVLSRGQRGGTGGGGR